MSKSKIDIFAKKDIQVVNTRMKNASLIIREIQTKMKMKYHFTLIIMVIIKKSTNKNKCQRGLGEKGTLLHYWWEKKLAHPLRKTV